MHRNEGSEEQYEGGRTGSRREEREYRDTDNDSRRDDEMESAKLATKLVQNELKKRAAVGLSYSIRFFFQFSRRQLKLSQKRGQQQVPIVH